MVSSFSNQKSELLIIYYRAEFRKYSVLRTKEKKEQAGKKDQYLDLCLVQIREELLMTFENQEIENVEIYNFGKILKVTKKIFGSKASSNQFLSYFFHNQNEPVTEIKSEYYFLDFDLDLPDGAKVSQTKLLECKPSLKYTSNFFDELKILYKSNSQVLDSAEQGNSQNSSREKPKSSPDAFTECKLSRKHFFMLFHDYSV